MYQKELRTFFFFSLLKMTEICFGSTILKIFWKNGRQFYFLPQAPENHAMPLSVGHLWENMQMKYRYLICALTTTLLDVISQSELICK